MFNLHISGNTKWATYKILAGYKQLKSTLVQCCITRIRKRRLLTTRSVTNASRITNRRLLTTRSVTKASRAKLTKKVDLVKTSSKSVKTLWTIVLMFLNIWFIMEDSYWGWIAYTWYLLCFTHDIYYRFVKTIPIYKSIIHIPICRPCIADPYRFIC